MVVTVYPAAILLPLIGGDKLSCQRSVQILIRNVSADKCRARIRLFGAHRNGAAVCRQRLLTFAVFDTVCIVVLAISRNAQLALAAAGADRQALEQLERNGIQKIAERLIIRRRKIGAEGKDGLRLPVRHGVAAAVRKLSRRIGRIVCAVISPGVLARADDPDIPLLRVYIGGQLAERHVVGIVCKPAVFRKGLGIDRDLLRAADIGDAHAHLHRIIFYPVGHLHELVPATLTRLGRGNVLLRADDDRHPVDTVAAAVGKAPLIHIAADRRGILIERALFVGVQLRKLISIRNSLGACKLGSLLAVPLRSELDLFAECRCFPVKSRPWNPLRRRLIVKRRLLKAAVFDGVVRNAARIGRQNRSWQQTQRHCQHHQSADGPLFPISFDVHDRSSLLLWGVKEVSNPLFLLTHRIGL